MPHAGAPGPHQPAHKAGRLAGCWRPGARGGGCCAGRWAVNALPCGVRLAWALQHVTQSGPGGRSEELRCAPMRPRSGQGGRRRCSAATGRRRGRLCRAGARTQCWAAGQSGGSWGGRGQARDVKRAPRRPLTACGFNRRHSGCPATQGRDGPAECEPPRPRICCAAGAGARRPG